MLGACRWLSLEVKYIDPIAAFYREHLAVETTRETDRAVAFDVGGSELVLRRPDGVPRGGLHTHYALSCPADAYETWWNRLDEPFDLQEVEFGSMRSLYFYDPEGNCVEIADAAEPCGSTEPTLAGVFEVVFEVERLPEAESFYTDLGFEVIDEGANRRRTRLTNGSLDIELWEPHLGLADARGGVHVDVGIEADRPGAAADRVDDRTTRREVVDSGIRIRDPDGHYVTLVD